MGTEIKQTLSRNYGLTLSSAEIRSLTFAKLVEMDKSESTSSSSAGKEVEKLSKKEVILNGDSKNVNA